MCIISVIYLYEFVNILCIILLKIRITIIEVVIRTIELINIYVIITYNSCSRITIMARVFYFRRVKTMVQKNYEPKYYTVKELNKRTGIYQIRNKVNNKIYVGSANDLQARRREHLYDLINNKHHNSHLQNAFNKYGEKNFIFEVIEFCDLDNKFIFEQYWINTLDSCNKKIGYNISNIVSVVKPHTKAVVCLENNKIFKSIKEASVYFQIQASDISYCCSKKIKTAGGYHWISYKEYIEMSQEDIKRKLLDNKCNNIINIDTNIIYKNYHDTGLKKSYVVRVCNKLKNKEYTSVKHGRFLYLKDYKNMSPEEINEIKKLSPRYKERSGRVICLETREIYNNAHRASIATNTEYNTLLKCCYKKVLTANGLHWLFLKDYNKMTEKEIKEMIDQTSRGIKIIHLKTKIIFSNIKETSKYFNISQESISKICRGIIVHEEKFMFYNDYIKSSEKDINLLLSLKPINNLKKPVRCIETGEVFNSVTEASKKVGAETTNISKCCKDKKYICKGFHWEYIDITKE